MKIALTTALLDLAFRPLFILGSLFSILALLIWGVFLSNTGSVASILPMQLWHGHEMLYGFVAAILIGFLLTAVQSWTGLRSINGISLIVLCLLWLSGRLTMWPFVEIDWSLRLIADCSFLLTSAFFLGRLLYLKRQKRNYFAVLAVLLLVADNIIFHISIQAGNLVTATQSLYSVILILTLMMAVIGGRVIPMFTANATQIPPRRRINVLDNTGLCLMWLLVLVYLVQLQTLIPPALLCALFLSTALLTAIRCLQWRFRTTNGHPLLWSLHIGYWCIPIGLALFGLHYAGMMSFSIGLHTLTVGAMGGLILSMISRVSLGHTGRGIIANPIITLSLSMILIAGLFRVIAFVFAEYSQQIWWLSIALWIAAYLLFLIQYVPILISPRVDSQK